MRIKVKNIPKDKVSKAEVGEATEYFLTKLIGENKVKGLGTVLIKFRKMQLRQGGSAIARNWDSINQEIIINSRKSKEDIFRVLAHECTHIKQYFLKELKYELQINGWKTKQVTIWKGKRILRSNYRKRAWEVEARKFESMATNLKSKLAKGNIEVIEKPKVEIPIQKPVSNTESKVLDILKEKDILNGDLVGLVLEGNTDKQLRIKVLKEVYAIKELGIIEEYNVNGIVWVRENKKEE